jgi:hypothetical protein
MDYYGLLVLFERLICHPLRKIVFAGYFTSRGRRSGEADNAVGRYYRTTCKTPHVKDAGVGLPASPVTRGQKKTIYRYLLF